MGTVARKALLVGILAVMAFSVIGLAYTPQTYFWESCSGWQTYDTYYRCNHTHRCMFFIYKGCYEIREQQRFCQEMMQTCWFDIFGNLISCDPPVQYDSYWDYREIVDFEWCYCNGATPSGCY